MHPSTAALLEAALGPRWHADLPGIGGVLKASPDDFEVEEIPAYEPSGSGEHLLFFVERRGIATPELIRRMARALDVPVGEIGSAGLKDACSISRQMFSAPARALANLPLIEATGARVLRHGLHGNKLRTGHLRGNRFRIVLRDTEPDPLTRAAAIAVRIGERGAPAVYGRQRFGHDGRTLSHGLELAAAGGNLPRRHPASKPWLKRLAFSALQSAVFNATLYLRMGAGLLDQVLEGDVLMRVPDGNPFSTTDPVTDQSRLVLHEIAPAGPLPGPRMPLARGPALEFESAALQRCQLEPSAFAAGKKLARGGRRAMIVHPENLRFAVNEPRTLELEFTLPSGVYATSLIAEFTGADSASASGIDLE